jgi:hypothetical protein
MAIRLRQRIGSPQVAWPRVGGAVLSTGAMVVILLFVCESWPLPLRVVVGAGAYLATALITGALRPSDRNYLRRGVDATLERVD